MGKRPLTSASAISPHSCGRDSSCLQIGLDVAIIAVAYFNAQARIGRVAATAAVIGRGDGHEDTGDGEAERHIVAL